MYTLILGTGSHARMLWSLTGRVHPMLAIGDTLDPDAVPNAGSLIIGVGNRPTVGDSGLNARATLYTAYAERIEGYEDATSVMRGLSCHHTAQIFARAVLNTDSIIAENVIVNTGAIVEHDVRVGAHSHVAPGAIILGAATIGDRVHIGAGAVVLPGLVIGDGAVVAAGAVVVADVLRGGYVARLAARG